MHTSHTADNPKPLTPKERAVLFSTRVVSVQIQRYIEAKGVVDMDQLVKAFPEVKRRDMGKRIKNLSDRGIVIREAGCFIATYKVQPYGDQADRAWKAARLLKTFNPGQIARLADVEREHAGMLCRYWRDSGHLVKIGQQGAKSPIYRLVSSEVIRPASNDKGV